MDDRDYSAENASGMHDDPAARDGVKVEATPVETVIDEDHQVRPAVPASEDVDALSRQADEPAKLPNAAEVEQAEGPKDEIVKKS